MAADPGGPSESGGRRPTPAPARASSKQPFAWGFADLTFFTKSAGKLPGSGGGRRYNSPEPSPTELRGGTCGKHPHDGIRAGAGAGRGAEPRPRPGEGEDREAEDRGAHQARRGARRREVR